MRDVAPSLRDRSERQPPRLSPRLPASGAISITPQTLEPFIAEALDDVAPEHLPKLRLTGTPEALRRDLKTGLDACGFAPAWLAAWLLENVLFQARLFGELTRARTLSLRLEAVADDGCCRFHADAVRYRLLTTYRGPGTEWLDAAAAAHVLAGMPPSPDAINRLERGSVAILRGTGAAATGRLALLHRSPPIVGTGATRLVLVVDEAGQIRA